MRVGIVERYVVREVGLTLLAVLALVLAITSGNFFARMLSRASEGRLPADILLPFVALGSLKSFIYLLSVALFMAIILSFGRMYKDSEMAALRACGIGYGKLYRALSLLVVPYALMSLLLVVYVSPALSRASEQLRASAEGRSALVGITPGRFVEIAGGREVLFVEAIEPDGERMRNVFLYSRAEGESRIVTARSAVQEVDPATGRRFLILLDGMRYEGRAGGGGYRVAQFARHGVLVSDAQETQPGRRRDMMSMRELLASDDPKDTAELHWRLVVPASILVLSMVALPLSYVAPRQGRFGKIFAAILVYVIYANLATMGRTWLEKEVLPAWVGLWWVHLAMLALTVALLVRQYGAAWVFGRLRLPGR